MVARRGVGVGRKPVLVLVGALLFGIPGCVKRVWVKEGSTRADYKKDSYECERDMRQVNYGRGDSPRGFYNRCMEARGWHLEERPDDPRPWL